MPRELQALRPDVQSFGFAAVLSINATSVWGGIYPYLPQACQTEFITMGFYCVQILVFAVSFFGWMALTWIRPLLVQRKAVLPFASLLAAGPLLLVAAMYIETAALGFIFSAAAVIGFALAAFMVCWQKVFAGMEAAQGNLALIKGTMFSAVLYLCICMVPQALTAFLIPLVLVPVAALCLWLAQREISLNQPMFEDVPQEHAAVYRNALRESLSPALSVGALGFVAGAIRFIAVTHQDLLSTINIVSMVILLCVMLVFYFLWQRHTLRMNLSTIFLVLFPLVAGCLVLLPFVGSAFTNFGFGIANGCFMLACVFMMIHCAQLSRDSGINPVFIYGFYGALAYIPQVLGYALGFGSGIEIHWGVGQFSFVSLVSLFVLLLVALFGMRGGFALQQSGKGSLEFLTLENASKASVVSLHMSLQNLSDEALELEEEEVVEEALENDANRNQSARVSGAPASTLSDAFTSASSLAAYAPSIDGVHVKDALSKRCQQVAADFALSSRETEVMELIARGYTGPAIAEMLFISENTMRTHNKRIYVKLDVHKKRELLELIESYE